MQPQNSQNHMEMMTMTRDRDIQSSPSVDAQTIESEKKNVDSPSPPRFTAFRDGVRGIITQNLDRTMEARRYDEETNDFAFMLRSMGPTAYQGA
jgi:hypothetical protein